jgi:hypothetical protein
MTLDNDSEFPLGWRPEQAGDTISGTVTHLETGTSRFEPFCEYPIIILDTRDGQMAIHCFHQALKSRVENVACGNTISVRYEGRRDSRNGRSYHAYTVTRTNGELPF